ncbi:MAG: ACP S-malonyltransferase [Desulfovibrio sp.]
MTTAILFPGQGSQEKGMGQELAYADKDILELWKFAEKESAQPLREIYWDGEAKDMADTRALQPALTMVNIGLWMKHGKNLAPSATAGHSLGEFASLCASGILTPKETLSAVTLRGKLMAESGGAGHGMAAILKMKQEQVEEVVQAAAQESGKELRIANYNTPAQYVISGEEEALKLAQSKVKEAKGRAIALAVSGAFHSPLIQDAADEFAEFLQNLDWKVPAFPVYFNATAVPEENPEKIKEIMCSQMTSSVYWIQIMANMYETGTKKFIELGPKGVLNKMLTANLKERGDDWTGENIDS